MTRENFTESISFLFFFLSVGCHEQGYAGDIIVHGICVWSIDIRTRCSTSHIQIGSRLACLNLLAMQLSTPISAYHLKNHPYTYYTYTRAHIHTKLYRKDTRVHRRICNMQHACVIRRIRYIQENKQRLHLYQEIFSRPYLGEFRWKIFDRD